MAFRIVRCDDGVQPMLGLPHISDHRSGARPECLRLNKRRLQQPAVESAATVETNEAGDSCGYLFSAGLRRCQAASHAGPHAAVPSLLDRHVSLARWYEQEDPSR